YTLLAQILAGNDLGAYVQTNDFCELLAADQGASNNGTGCVNSSGMPLPLPTASVTAGDLYRLDFDQDVTSTALFGQATDYVTEKIDLTPGLRFNKEKKRVDAHGNSDCQQKGNGQPCFMEQILDAEDYNELNHHKSEGDVDPKLALQFFSEHGVNYYAS